MERLSSSLRELSVHEAKRRLMSDAAKVGVSRVTNITAFDSIGIPAYSSVRVSGSHDVLHVHNGKGARAIEAEVGAYAEAIEFAVADRANDTLTTIVSTPRQIEEQSDFTADFVSLCPQFDADIDPDGPIDAVEVRNFRTGRRILLPKELVVHPLRTEQQRIFGTSTNGLASGSTEKEAILHATCEVIERDTHTIAHAEHISSPH